MYTPNGLKLSDERTQQVIDGFLTFGSMQIEWKAYQATFEELSDAGSSYGSLNVPA